MTSLLLVVLLDVKSVTVDKAENELCLRQTCIEGKIVILNIHFFLNISFFLHDDAQSCNSTYHTYVLRRNAIAPVRGC